MLQHNTKTNQVSLLPYFTMEKEMGTKAIKTTISHVDITDLHFAFFRQNILYGHVVSINMEVNEIFLHLNGYITF